MRFVNDQFRLRVDGREDLITSGQVEGHHEHICCLQTEVVKDEYGKASPFWPVGVQSCKFHGATSSQTGLDFAFLR